MEKTESVQEEKTIEKSMEINKNFAKYLLLLPIIITFLFLLGFSSFYNKNTHQLFDNGFYETNSNLYSTLNTEINILTEEDVAHGIKDTVYTTFNCWLELRIDRQMLYQHWRNGKISSYPVSTGNKYLSRSVESRPGLFAIFHKEEHHQSTQYNNADMYYFMPFNQGIGFHSLNGTGYYGALGKTPSSHGCIRMRHEDAKKLFLDCPLGTLVLAHKGYTARTVGFAPQNYENDIDFTKDQFKYMLAENLYNILEGLYYVKARKFFIVNPKIVPLSGIYISYDKKIPQKQKLPVSSYRIEMTVDRIYTYKSLLISSIELMYLAKNDTDLNNEDDEETTDNKGEYTYSEMDLVKKYFHNPIGILPYFPPNR